MKFLIVLLVLLFGVWLWRRGRARQQPSQFQRAGKAAQAMVDCARCGVHVPQVVAVPGRSGIYCCEAHRREAEGG